MGEEWRCLAVFGINQIGKKEDGFLSHSATITVNSDEKACNFHAKYPETRYCRFPMAGCGIFCFCEMHYLYVLLSL